MITASSMNPMGNDNYTKLMNTQPPPPTDTLLNTTTPLYDTGVDNTSSSTTTVPDLLLTENNNSNHSNTSGPSSAEEAVFLPTTSYATKLLPPTTKLEEEPNPFEQSFEATTVKQKTVLPSVNSIDNPKSTRLDALLSVENQWDSLRSGILSPSMLPGPTNTSTTVNHSRRPTKYESETPTTTTFYNHTYDNPPTVNSNRNSKQSRKSDSTSSQPPKSSNKKQKTSKSQQNNNNNDEEDEEKRKNFLERNRIAALKCRQRKKQWLQNLQTKVEYLAADNEQYHMQANALREELINLKTLLMAHKDCPISQQEMEIALNRPIPGVPNLPHLLKSTVDSSNSSSSSNNTHSDNNKNDAL